MKNIKFIAHKAFNLRKWSIIAPTHAGSGHTSTCLSAADIVAVLFFNIMHYDIKNFENPDNDRFILSKGHASPLLYAAWKELGLLTEKDMLAYRSIHSTLEGHPTFRFKYTEAATGSLGIGLSIGVGQALSAKMDKKTFYTYVLMGDSETTEGSVWEAVQLAAYYKLDNLIAIIDCNRLGQSTPTLFEHDTQRYTNIFTAFGWNTIVTDGHDINALIKKFEQIKQIKNKPTVVIAKTFKGYGVDLMHNKEGYHGKPIEKENLALALQQLEKNFPQNRALTSLITWAPPIPKKHTLSLQHNINQMPMPNYKKNDSIATRKAYGQALTALGNVSDLIVSLDAEVKNSTFAELFEQKHPNRFFQCFIAEQNMVSMGVGLHRRGKIPFISTFGAFFSRAYDQIRMAAIGNANINLIGSHCGVSIGQDGPSQMALEDIALMRLLPESVVLYPSDAVSTYKLVQQMAQYTKGMCYLRTTRAETPVLYSNNETFPIGGCKIIKQSNTDLVCIITAGITLFEALKAYIILAKENISISIIDLYCIKPLDVKKIQQVALKSGKKIITIEDHYPEGGIGETIVSALKNNTFTIECLAVNRLPRSGKPEELLAYEEIDAHAIVKKVKQLI